MAEALCGHLLSTFRKARRIFNVASLENLDYLLGPGWWLHVHANNVHSVVIDIESVELVYDYVKKVSH